MTGLSQTASCGSSGVSSALLICFRASLELCSKHVDNEVFFFF